jgi:purine-binding chemotaxis protein CheW
VSKYLTFGLEREDYAIDVLRVHEIRTSGAITAVPNAPAHVRGVMNLRGTIIPVVDLRTRLGMPEIEAGRVTAIVVITVGAKIMGLIVDSVSDVIDIPPAAVQPPGGFTGHIDTRFLTGLARADGRLVVLLDLERLLGSEDPSALSAA